MGRFFNYYHAQQQKGVQAAVCTGQRSRGPCGQDAGIMEVRPGEIAVTAEGVRQGAKMLR